MLPERIHQLARLFARLPSVGEKTALRFVLHLSSRDLEGAKLLAQALGDLADHVGTCTRCGSLADTQEGEVCGICRDTKRDSGLLCVVARIQDLLSIERSSAFRGYYFVLGKLLSPLEGVGADALPLDALIARLRDPESVREVLLATPPSVDGEATALLLAQQLQPTGVAITRIASGVPHGGDLEFADPVTIGRAIAGRRDVE